MSPIPPLPKAQPAMSLEDAVEGLWMALLSLPKQLKAVSRLTLPVRDLSSFFDVLQVLEMSPVVGRFYWSNRPRSFEILGVGMADDIHRPRQSDLPECWRQMQCNTQGSSACYMGGLSFSGRSGSGMWQGFEALRFCLPLLELRRYQGRVELSVQLFAQDERAWQDQLSTIRELLNTIVQGDLPLAMGDLPQQTSSRYLTGIDQWHRQVDGVLQSVRDGRLEKAVLARATFHQLCEAPGLAVLADRWQKRSHQTYGFVFNFGHSSFMGFSPERLLRQRGNEIATEALAATQPRGQTAIADEKYERALLTDVKLVHEHQLVTRFIRECLRPYTRALICDSEVAVVKLANVQHSQVGFRALMNDPDDIASLLLALFPTPAVCGLPKKAAFNCISSCEQNDRGWYAGAVGFVGDNQCEFNVAIRSGLLNNSEFISYAGAGIVDGSEASAEWDELNDKSSIVQRILE